MYAFFAYSARRALSAAGNTPSGSTSRSKRALNADRAGAVALVGSAVIDQRLNAASRALIRGKSLMPIP